MLAQLPQQTKVSVRSRRLAKLVVGKIIGLVVRIPSRGAARMSKQALEQILYYPGNLMPAAGGVGSVRFKRKVRSSRHLDQHLLFAIDQR